MALRILSYTSLLYQELVRSAAPVLDEHGRLPCVLPVVIYNGETPWRAAEEVGELVQPADAVLASCRPSQRYRVLDERHVGADDLPGRNLMTAVVRLEQIRSLADLVPVVRLLRSWLRSPEDDELRRVFTDWVREIAERLVPEGEEVPPDMTLEEMEMTLVERVSEWPKQWLREGIEQGSRTRPGRRAGAVASHGGIAVRSGHRGTAVGGAGGNRGPGASGRGGRVAGALRDGGRVPCPRGLGPKRGRPKRRPMSRAHGALHDPDRLVGSHLFGLRPDDKMFEWDPARNASNRRKHGISFEEAIEIFNGPVLARTDDDIYEEPRERSYGLIRDVVVVCVVPTERGSAGRVISARKATRKEREEFHAYLTRTTG